MAYNILFVVILVGALYGGLAFFAHYDNKKINETNELIYKYSKKEYETTPEQINCSNRTVNIVGCILYFKEIGSAALVCDRDAGSCWTTPR